MAATPTLVQPPRPPNAWILYRSHMLSKLPPVAPGQPKRPQAEVSKMISEKWKGENPVVRQEFERQAEVRKAEHQMQYPGYKYQPTKKEEKDRIRESKVAEKQAEKKKRGKKRTRSPSPGPSSRQQPVWVAVQPPSSMVPFPVMAAPVQVPPFMIGPSYPCMNHPSPPLSAAGSVPSTPSSAFTPLNLDTGVSLPSRSLLSPAVSAHPLDSPVTVQSALASVAVTPVARDSTHSTPPMSQWPDNWAPAPTQEQWNPMVSPQRTTNPRRL